MSKAIARAKDFDVVFAIWTDDLNVSRVGCGGVDGQWWPYVGDNAATIGQMLNGTMPDFTPVSSRKPRRSAICTMVCGTKRHWSARRLLRAILVE